MKDPASLPSGGQSPKGFWVAALSTILLGLGLLGLFNAASDPYRVVGSPRVRGFNDVQASPPSIWREGTTRYLGALARDSAARVVLIGSSHVRSGIPTCRRPEILRLTASGVTGNETRQLLGEALSSARWDRTFLVEVPPTDSSDAPIDIDPPPLPRVFLGTEATDLSWRQLRASATADPGPQAGPLPPGCMAAPELRSLPYPFTGIQDQAVAILGESGPPPSESARATIDVFLRGCGPHRHRLRLFLLPVHEDLLAYPGVERSLQAEAQRLRTIVAAANAAATGACSVSFVDLTRAVPAWQADGQSWYDPTHFKPALGDTILSLLLAGVDQGQNRS